MSKAHPGFKKVQSNIEKEGYSKAEAGAILASTTRKASAKAKKKNPKLKKVKGSGLNNIMSAMMAKGGK